MKKVRILLIFNNLAVFNLGGSGTFHYGGGFGIGSKNCLFNRLRMEYLDSIPNLTIRRQFTQRHKLLVSASESPSHRPWMSESLFSAWTPSLSRYAGMFVQTGAPWAGDDIEHAPSWGYLPFTIIG